MRDRYFLVAAGTMEAIRWAFPKLTSQPEQHGAVYRHAFPPAADAVTVERELRQVCARWQDAWDSRMADEEMVQAAVSRPTTPETLKQAYEHHQAHYASLLGPRTREQYPARMQEWLDYLGDDIRLEDITAEAILAVRAKMQATRKSSNTTINGKVSTLKKVLNMAHRKGWVTRAVWRDVPPLRLIRHPVRYWNADQVAVAFAVAKEDDEPGRATLMLVLGIYLGLRKNEAVHVRWQDLHLDRLHPRTGQPSPICLIEQRPGFTTKTYENRKVPVSAEAKALLLQHKPVKAKPEDYVLDAERHHKKRGGTKRVYRYDPVKVWARVLKAAMAKGNPRIEFKEMRHSFACNCLLLGHNVEKVARWLGHKDPRMVRQHYAFLLDYDDDTGLKFLEDE
jgi:integrase